jgi:S-adenosyl methyltransferase
MERNMEGNQPVPGIQTSIPNVARMYDYMLGGKDNFAADREAAERTVAVLPQSLWLARQNRRFLERAVRFCASAGITQFLDIGSGLPTMQNVHQVAEQVITDPHVVYVDHDPVVVSHAQALLTTPRTVAVHGELSRPEEILTDPQVCRLIDFDRPVAILLVAVLHFLPAEVNCAGAVAKLRAAMAPGSYLVISCVEFARGHAVGEEFLSDAVRELANARKGMPRLPALTREQIAGFFGDLTLMEPGLVDVWHWRPEGDEMAVMASDVIRPLGGVARKD